MAALPQPARILVEAEVMHPCPIDAAVPLERQWAVIAGRVADSGLIDGALKSGDEVIAYFEQAHGRDQDNEMKTENSVMAATRVFKKPKSMSFADAAGMAMGYAKAAAIMQQELGIWLPNTLSINDYSRQYDGKRISVLGGETDVGVSLVQLLHWLETECNITVTSSMDDQYWLLQRTVHLVSLGARYGIDGQAEDLMEHLRADIGDSRGVDVILDVVGAAGERPELVGLLAEEGKYVDCRNFRNTGRVVSDLLDNMESATVTEFERLLCKAAEAFQTLVEPSCPLGDESDSDKQQQMKLKSVETGSPSSSDI